MRKLPVYVLCLFVLCLFAIPCTSFAWNVEGAVGYWMQMPSGTLEYKPVSSIDTLDIKSDLKYDTKYQPYARIKADLPLFLPNIYIMATPMYFNGSGNKSFSFGGYSFTGAFESRLKLDHYDLALYYSLPFLKKATLDVLNVEIGINARVIDFEARVTELSSGTSVSKSLTIPVPMVYLGMQVKPVKAISIEAEARGIAYGSSHYFDIIGRAKVTVYGPVFVAAGYRYEKVKIDVSDVKADIDFSGPFVELGLAF
jgi:outer membrane protein